MARELWQGGAAGEWSELRQHADTTLRERAKEGLAGEEAWLWDELRCEAAGRQPPHLTARELQRLVTWCAGLGRGQKPGWQLPWGTAALCCRVHLLRRRLVVIWMGGSIDDRSAPTQRLAWLLLTCHAGPSSAVCTHRKVKLRGKFRPNLIGFANSLKVGGGDAAGLKVGSVAGSRQQAAGRGQGPLAQGLSMAHCPLWPSLSKLGLRRPEPAPVAAAPTP